MGLGDKLRAAMERLRSATVVDKALVKEVVKEIQRALIASDVSVEMVLKLSKRIEDESLKEGLPKGLTRREHVIKTTHNILVGALGGNPEVPQKPKRILLVGLYGFGKTTTTGKLAKYYTNRGLKVGVIAGDTYRPAAYEQLEQVAGKVKGVSFCGDKKENVAAKVVRKCVKELEDRDLVICDSAGRSALDDELVDEIKAVKNGFGPEEIWLVLGADVGQLAEKQAKAFHEAVGVNGIIISRMDGSAKGGGALAACAATGASVYFIGTGERVEDLEEFDATRYLSRIMGYGDLKALMEKASKIEAGQVDVEEMMKGEFNIKMFYDQLKAARQMGPLGKVMEMAGLGSQIPKEQLEVSEEKLDSFKVIMDSMTEEEKVNPDVLNKSRIARVARGSGTTQEEVRELIKHYKQMKNMFKKLKNLNPEKMGKKGMDMGGIMKKFGKKKKLKLK